MGLVKGSGLQTFTTAINPVVIRDVLDPVLDVRTWWIDFISSPEAAGAHRAEVRESGDRFWCYGSGSYIGREGRMIANRYITGYLFYKSGAEAMWSWTFQRAKDQPYDLGNCEAERSHRG